MFITSGETKTPLTGAYTAVREFHRAFNHPVGKFPSALGEERRDFRYHILAEEVEEFKEATQVEDQVDAMIDTIYIALGTLVELGVEPDEVFNIVQTANMRKLDPRTREPLYHTEGIKKGKVKKPEGWEAPEPYIVEEVYTQAQMHYLRTHPKYQDTISILANDSKWAVVRKYVQLEIRVTLAKGEELTIDKETGEVFPMRPEDLVFLVME